MVAGCTNTFAPEKINRDPLFLSPASLGKNLSLSQIVIGTHNGKTISMRVEIEVTAEHLIVVGLSPLGVKLFSLQHDGGTPIVDVLAGGEKADIDPRFVLFDIYMTYWPTEVLQDALKIRGMQLKEDDSTRTRIIYSAQGNILGKVLYSAPMNGQNEILIEHYDFPYSLRIKQLGQGYAK